MERGGEEGKERESETKRAALLIEGRQGDAYNYAARFLLLPKVWCGQRGIEKVVHISLTEHGIRAVGTHLELGVAHAKASRKFMERAGKYLKLMGDAVSPSSDSQALSTKNSIEFVAFAQKTLKLQPDVIILPAGPVLEPLGIKRAAEPLLFNSGLCKPIPDFGTGDIRRIASLVLAVDIQRHHPELLPLFLKELEKPPLIPAYPIHPVPLPLGQDCLSFMRDSLNRARGAGLPDVKADPGVDLNPVHEFRKRNRFSMEPKATMLRSEQLKRDVQLTTQNRRKKPKQLPVFTHRDEVLELVNRNIFSIVRGPPASGMSTQVPQILLDDAIQYDEGPDCNIIITQRSQSAAISRAFEVAEERDRDVGDTVGYHTMSTCKAPPLTGGITYCTIEVLLLQLQHVPDCVLGKVSHLIIDDVHERDMDMDLLLIVLKRAIMTRLARDLSVPQVVLMSSSPGIDTFLLGRYFGSRDRRGYHMPCPLLRIRNPNRFVEDHFLGDIIQTFKEKYHPLQLEPFFMDRRSKRFLRTEEKFIVTENAKFSGCGNTSSMGSDDGSKSNQPRADLEVFFEEDTSQVPVGLVAVTIAHIVKSSSEGAILVFLPGYRNINYVEEKLLNERPLHVNFSDRSKFRIIKIHNQARGAISEIVPEGCRKIILCENVGEASTAMLDVQHVVDVGRVTQHLYYPEQLKSKPSLRWASKSISNERAGRAGLVRNGHYYALFTKTRYEAMRKAAVPELLRNDLQRLCLKVKAAGLSENISGFLTSAPEPPSLSSVDSAVTSLQNIGAMDNDQDLTPLGCLLRTLPIHPMRSKLIVLGIIFRCLEPMIITNTLLEPQSFFSDGIGKLKMSSHESCSDHITEINAFRTILDILRKEGEGAAFNYCQENSIRFAGFKSFLINAQQTVQILSDHGLIPKIRDAFEVTDDPFGDRRLNSNSSNDTLVKALIAGGIYPNICVLNSPVSNGWQSKGQDILSIATHSANHSREHSEVDIGSLMAFSGFNVRDHGTLMYRTSRITALMAFLFGGKIQGEGKKLKMDGWLPFEVEVDKGTPEDPETAAGILLEYRQTLDQVGFFLSFFFLS